MGGRRKEDAIGTQQLTVQTLQAAAREFAQALSGEGIAALYGVTDGKAVGTYIETVFNAHIIKQFNYTPGNAAKGIDFPDLDVDLKVTSLKQPQSSCPFRDAAQKVYGLGYNLLVFVYDKTDDPQLRQAVLDFRHVIFIESAYTADYQTTMGLRTLLDRGANVDDIDAFLEERVLPLDEIGRRQLAERISEERPEQGYMTISNALQWRLQYGRAIGASRVASVMGIADLIA